MHPFEFCLFFDGGAVEESEEMQARPVYVAAVDLACKFLAYYFCFDLM